MSADVQHDDRTDLWLVIVDGKPMTGQDGRPLGFEDRQRALDVAESRKQLARPRLR